MKQKRASSKWIRFFVLSAIVAGIIGLAFSTPPTAQAQSADAADIWFVHAQDSQWQSEEVALVQGVLARTIKALDEAGYDGRALFAGYRFRRYAGEYVNGVQGQIALVRHNSQEIILGDAAFVRLWGYYIYHELGHVVDKRTGRALSDAFQAQIGGDGVGTPDGYWLNDHARGDREEGTADAFALWITMRYTDNPRPVFAHIPNDTDYEQIVSAFETAMAAIH